MPVQQKEGNQTDSQKTAAIGETESEDGQIKESKINSMATRERGKRQ